MKKVAILGGGVGALAAAFKLTQQPDWESKFDITVYQLGWRLGGKGASSRNLDFGNRVEEHGLHVWAGFYENAFALMRAAYAGRPADGSRITTVEEAFLPQNHVVFTEKVGDEWKPWFIYFAPNDAKPGDGSADFPLPNVAGYVTYLLDWVADLFGKLPEPAQAAVAAGAPAVPEHVTALAPAGLQPLGANRASGVYSLNIGHALSLQLGQANPLELFGLTGALVLLVKMFRAGLDLLRPMLLDLGDFARRMALLMDLGTAGLLCILEEGVLREGFGVLDQYEFCEVLRKYGIWEETIESPLVASLYDYVFGFAGGDRAKPVLSACSAFEGALRLVVTYKGSLFYKMAAGAGEIIFTPSYQALVAAGVKFRFFHRVLELVPADGKIGAIRIGVQAGVKAGEFRPLVKINGLYCWPAEPDFAQLTNGDVLKDQNIDLEDTFGDYRLSEITLQAGVDFDDVVLGIPSGALAEITPQLNVPGSPWANMLAGTPTVATQALQLWLDLSLEELGGPFVAPQPLPDIVGPIATGFAPPFDTWSDMSHLLPTEDWGASPPKNVAYFCSVLKDVVVAPGVDPQETADAAARASAVELLERNIAALWPNAADASGFHWGVLHADAAHEGQARLDDQYVRANVTGTERYVLSPPGTRTARLAPGASGYANLYLAGDWARVASINAGCMEVAVMAGFGAANALAGVADDTVA